MENYGTLTTGTFRVCYGISALIFRKMLWYWYCLLLSVQNWSMCRCCVVVSHAAPVKPSAIPSRGFEQTLHTVLLMWHLIELGSGSHKLTAFYCNTGLLLGTVLLLRPCLWLAQFHNIVHCLIFRFSFLIFICFFASYSWKNDNCDRNKNITTWTVHGLWPSVNETYPNYCNGTSCKLKETDILQLEDKMRKFWPSFGGEHVPERANIFIAIQISLFRLAKSPN